MVEIFLVEQSLKLRLKLYDKHLNKHLIKTVLLLTSAGEHVPLLHRLSAPSNKGAAPGS